MSKRVLKNIIDMKNEALHQLRLSPQIMALILNNPNVDMESEEVETAETNNFFDHGFTDSTFQTDRAVIFVESTMVDRPNDNFMSAELMVQIVCNKDYIELSPSLFKGVVGNRNDNLAMAIAEVLDLDDAEDFGIGCLILTECTPKSVPDGFSSLMLIFEVEDFAI